MNNSYFMELKNTKKKIYKAWMYTVKDMLGEGTRIITWIKRGITEGENFGRGIRKNRVFGYLGGRESGEVRQVQLNASRRKYSLRSSA